MFLIGIIKMKNISFKSAINRFSIAAILLAVPVTDAFARRGGGGGGSIIGMILAIIAIIVIAIVWNLIVAAAKGVVFGANTANTVSTKASGLTIQRKPWDEQKKTISGKINNLGVIFIATYGEEAWDAILNYALEDSKAPEYKDFPITTLTLGYYATITMSARAVMDQASTTTAPASKSLYKGFAAIEELCVTVAEGHMKAVLASFEDEAVETHTKNTTTAYSA